MLNVIGDKLGSLASDSEPEEDEADVISSASSEAHAEPEEGEAVSKSDEVRSGGCLSNAAETHDQISQSATTLLYE